MQIASCHSLSWFTGPEFFIELLFAFITIIIGFYAYKLFKLSRQRSILLFGVGFISMSAAYFIQAFLNLLILRNVVTNDIVKAITGNIAIQTTLQLSVLATIFYIVFMTFGLAVLSYVTLKERGTKIFLLIISLSFVGLIFSSNPLLVFYLLTTIFLLFITAQHYQRHGELKSYSSLFVFSGFGMLFLGNAQLIFSDNFGLLYVSGLIVLLMGYLLLLASLVNVVRK